MRIGVYVDAFNLYYGGRSIMGGAGQPGWKWLDIRKLSERVVAQRSRWADAELSRIVYCTARVHEEPGSTRYLDQDAYIEALTAAKSIDVCEEGSYVYRLAKGPLARPNSKGRPVLETALPFVEPENSAGEVPQISKLMVRVARREEKGSDVNVATHLIIDICEKRIDAAVIFTNDSDLAFPIRHARTRVPVGVVNPSSKRYPAGALQGSPRDGVGGHWWYSLREADLTSSQLPRVVGPISRPSGW